MIRAIAIFSLAGLATQALGAISVSLVPVSIPPSVTDSQASGFGASTYDSYDLQVVVTGGGDWASAQLRGSLSEGSFFNHAFGTNNAPNGALVPSFPALAFDTFVTTPSGSFLTQLPYPGDAGVTPIFSPSLTSVTWADLPNTGNGTFNIARITMTEGAVGTISGLVVEAGATSGVPFSLAVPEPASISMLALGALALRRRRKQ